MTTLDGWDGVAEARFQPKEQVALDVQGKHLPVRLAARYHLVERGDDGSTCHVRGGDRRVVIAQPQVGESDVDLARRSRNTRRKRRIGAARGARNLRNLAARLR